MNAAIEDVTKRKRPEPPAGEIAAQELARRSREQSLSLTRPDELLKQLAETVLETALNQELTGRLGHGKHGRPPGTGSGPGRFRPRPAAADRADEIVLSLYAKGLTTAEISAHFCCLCRSRAAASASESRCSAGSAWCQTYDLAAGLPAGLPGPDGRSEHP